LSFLLTLGEGPRMGAELAKARHLTLSPETLSQRQRDLVV